MTESFLSEIVKQGGFAMLAGVMFFVWRYDARSRETKLIESASAFISFGERTATALTLLTETMRQVGEAARVQQTVLMRIEERLGESHLCPVTQVLRTDGSLTVTDVLKDVSNQLHRDRLRAEIS